jgi:3D (Asp-Asp-Asp) domain-containing protein
MNKIFIYLIAVIWLVYCQDKQDQNLFHPHSDYLPYGSYQITFYSTIQEMDYPDISKIDSLKDKEGKLIKAVSAEFYRKLIDQENGKLKDGRLVHLVKTGDEQQYFKTVKNVKYGVGIKNYQLIPYRSVAVNPGEILLGSVLFIPQAAGTPMPDGTFHDGYFLVHDVLSTDNVKKIRIYSGFEEEANNKFVKSKKIFPDANIDIYLVHGVMEKVINLQYESQYQRVKTKQTYRMVWKDLEQLMQEAQKKEKNVSKRIEYISEYARGTPYVLFHLGEGVRSEIDLDPLIDFGRADCMTFCEHILALAISNDYRQMYDNLQRIRYKEGTICFTARNHYTIADWLPNNHWLLDDATEEIGGYYCAVMTKTVDRKKDFLQLGIAEENLMDIIPLQTITIKYVPEEYLIKIKGNLKGGEIVSIITSNAGIFSAHMGIIIRDEWGNIIFRHASSLEKNLQVMDQRFEEIVDMMKNSKSRVGMIFIRVKEDKF